MTWRREWKAISDRIVGILEGTRFLYSTGPDQLGAAKRTLAPNANGVFVRLQEFRARHGGGLPAPALEILGKTLAQWEPYEDSRRKPGGFDALQFYVTLLTSFRAEFEFHLADTEAAPKSLVERAFLHLQRSIVADPDVATRWRGVFEKGETACEKLGSVHLLLHGIWAFKASAEGERTDLVLGGPLQLTTHAESAVEALVLTEWKRVNSPSEGRQKAAQALAQAERYSAGILGGFELATQRYLVLVSAQELAVPDDLQRGDILYRHINICVTPTVPSRAAAQTKAASDTPSGGAP